MNEKFIINKKSLLLVEGKDEVSFFGELLNHINIKDVQCIPFNGKPNFKAHFETKIIDSDAFLDVNKIAFIFDSDKKSPQSAVTSIVNAISAINSPKNKLKNVISKCSLQNNIYKNSNIVCGLYIMPDNKSSGMLEDLCLKYVSSLKIHNCMINKVIEFYIESLKKNQMACSNNLSKAKLLTFLVCQKDNPYSLGHATLKNIFNFDDNAFSDIKIFLEKVFA